MAAWINANRGEGQPARNPDYFLPDHLKSEEVAPTKAEITPEDSRAWANLYAEARIQGSRMHKERHRKLQSKPSVNVKKDVKCSGG